MRRLHLRILVLTITCCTAFLTGVAWASSSYIATEVGKHALELTSGSASYSNIYVTKRGSSTVQSDDYDFKGTNAAVHASGGGTLTITGSSTYIDSNAKYGNAVFSYGGGSGDGTTIVISDAEIRTILNNSGGIMVTGGGIISADNLTITTLEGSSAAIRSDKGGGTINVNGGTYTTSGTGSPAIYSTATITVIGADLTANTSQGVVIEGGNSVTLTNSNLTAKHTTLNGQDTTHQAILIYQSMSGDASSGSSTFKMTGGKITNSTGDIFCVTNTTTTITLNGVTITNNDSSGNFLRAAHQNWGSNGGTVTLNATDQTISGNIVTDSSSSVTMNLSGASTFTGTINSANTGTVNVTVGSGSILVLSGNSYVKSLTNNGAINYGSYAINVNGTVYNASNPYSGSTTTETEASTDTDSDTTDTDTTETETDTSETTTTTTETTDHSATTAGAHAIALTDGTSKSYSNVTVTKTGDASGSSDDYDFKGTNAAVYASNKSQLTITGSSTKISSDAKYGNAVFSYGGGSGDGTKIIISDATITTSKNNSGGIMVTGGGIISADNLTITTSGGSSAAIRSDKGGGTITVNGGTYETSGQGSPAIYSTADITVIGADLTGNIAQGVVIEGGNSVTLTNSNLTAKHTTLNGQDSTHQAILIYQSMSGDASDGSSSFKMTGGKITNSTGDIFCVTNTTTTITLNGVTITNNDSSGNFLRAAHQNWGSNGGTVTLNASDQAIEGNVLVDSSSSLTMTLANSSTFKGAINPTTATTSNVHASAVGNVNVTVEKGSKLTLTADSTISSITVEDADDIDYGEYTLTVGGTEYNEDNPVSTGTTGTDTTTTEGNKSSSKTSGDSDSGCNTGISLLSLVALSFALKFKGKK